MTVVDLMGLIGGWALRTEHGWICLMAKRELWDDSQVCPSWVVWPFTEIGEVKEAVEVTTWTRREFAAEEGQRRDCKKSR